MDQPEVEQEQEKWADEIQPIGEGAFGKIYDQFKGKVKEAINILLKEKSGEAVGVLHHKDIDGEISLVWGNSKMGLAKIIEKHSEVLDDLQGVLDNMSKTEESNNRIKFESDTHFAVISKEYKGKPRDKWLLTTYEKRNSVNNNTTDTVETTTGNENDTATLGNTVSYSEDTTNSENNNTREQNIPPTKPAGGVNILDEAAKVVEKAKKQPHTYNIGDIVNIKGEQYEVTGTGHILDTDEAIYDLEKEGKVAYEDITEKELKNLIENVAQAEPTPTDIFAEAEKAVKNAEKSKLQPEKSADESDKKEVTETKKDKKLSENKAQKAEIQDNEQNKKAEKSIKKETSGEEKAEKVDKKEDSEKQPWEVTLNDWNKEDEVIASNQSEIVPHGGYVRNEETKKWEWQRGRNINSDKFLRRVDSNRNPISEWFYLKKTGRKLLTEEQHRRAVLQALSEGKHVPEEVLKEYPELSKTKEDEGKGAQFRVEDKSNEAEIKAIKAEAITNGTFMKAPNGKPTNLNERQWLQVRTKAFKEWFGDWEMAWKAEQILNSNPVSELRGDEFAKSDKSIIDQVADFFYSIGGKVAVKGIGEVELDKRSVKDSISHGLDRNKAVAFKAIPEILTQGQIIDKQSNWKGRGYNSYTVSAPITIGGERFVAIAIVNEAKEKDTHRFYLHEVVIQKSLQSEEFKTGMATGSPRGDIANVLRKIVTAKENSSKVVDENGEPMVVYHGTRQGDFHTFDRSKAKNYSSNSIADIGYWFSPIKGFGLSFAENTWGGVDKGVREMAVFLNIRNPKTYNETDKQKVELAKKRVESAKENAENIYKSASEKSATFDELGRIAFINAVEEERSYLRNGYVMRDVKNNTYLIERITNEENKNAIKLEVDAFKKAVSEFKEAKKEFSDNYNYTDAYENFRSDVYSKGGYSSEHANIGGLGVQIDNMQDVQREYLSALKASDYDGILIQQTRYDKQSAGGVNDQYIVLNPNQIKSASDNIGSFDSTNDDIRFRIIGETGASRMKNAEMLLDDLRVAREMEEAGNVEKLKDIVLNLFHKAAKGEITGKPIKIGDLTAKGQSFLSNLSGVDMKPYVSFVINPSDLRHIYNEHYQANEKDSGSNHPLTDMDVRNMIDVILFPEKIVSFNEDGITKFIFLAESPQVGAYNLVEVYGDKRGNLSAKSLYNTKKDVSHRAMTIIKQSRLSTSKTSGAILSETNVPNLFESTKSFDAKTIRIATGWERGADGKWRYETPDEKFTPEFVESLEKSSERYIDKRTQESYATVEDIYGENSELLKIYPSLAEATIGINIHPDNSNKGHFIKGTSGDKYTPGRGKYTHVEK